MITADMQAQQPPVGMNDGWMDDLNLTSFSTVFQSYQDDGQMIMKGCMLLFTVDKNLPRAGAQTLDARSVGQRLTH